MTRKKSRAVTEVRSATQESTVPPVNLTSPPEVEVDSKPVYRQFTAEYKRWVIEQADKCQARGELGVFLRREGLYSSHLSKWRRQLKHAQDTALEPRPAGRPVSPETSERRELARLARENERLKKRLSQAEAIIDIQKKVSELLGLTLPETNRSEE